MLNEDRYGHYREHIGTLHVFSTSTFWSFG